MSVANCGSSQIVLNISEFDYNYTPAVNVAGGTYATLLETGQLNTDDKLILLLSAYLSFTSVSTINLIDVLITWNDGLNDHNIYQSAVVYNDTNVVNSYYIPIRNLLSLTEALPATANYFTLQVTCNLQLSGTWSASASSISLLTLGTRA